MAYTSVKLAVDSSSYKTEMKSAATAMRELASEYNVAATKAKLFGSAADSLKAKAESLTQKIKVQEAVVKLNSDQQERLSNKLKDQKTVQEELRNKIDATKKAYEAEKEETGKNSDATKALKEEIDKLEEKFKENETAIGKTETALGNQATKTNESKVKLMEMEAELKKVNDELKNHKLDKFADGCEKAGEKIEKFGERMSVVSVGIGTFATVSAKMAVNFEDSIAKVSTIMDEGVMSVDEMEDAIIGLSNETGIAAGDIADNVYNAISAGQDTSDAVNFVRESTKLATAGFAESGDTLDILTTILNAYGLEAEKVTEVSDMLVQTQNLGKTTVSELSSAMGKVIPTANANSVALDQLCAGYAIMTANGVATAETTTYMNSMLNELGKTGSTTDVILREKTGKSFSELMQNGSSLADVLQIVDDAAKEENLTMSDMFSSAEAAKAGLILLGDSTESFNGTLDQMRQSTGATDTAFEKMQTTSFDINIAMNELKNTVLQFGQTIMSSAAPLVEQFTEKVHTLCEWFGSLDEGQQQTIIKIGLFTAAVGPAAVGIGKFAQGISSTIKTGQQFVSGVSSIIAKITAKTAATAAGTTADAAGTAATAAHTAATVTGTAATGGMTAAQKALNLVMSMNPIMKVVAVVSLLVAGFVALYKNSETFRNAVNKLWETIKNVFGKIKETISKITSAATETVKQNLNNMKTAYEENGGGIKGVVAAGWEGIKGSYTFGFNFIDKLTGGKLTEIKNKFLNSEVGQAASKVFNGVKNTVSKVMSATVTTAKEKLNNMKTAYEENGGGIKGIVAAGWEGIKGYYTAGFTFVDNLTGGKLTEIKDKFSDKLSEVKDVAKQKWNDIQVSYIEGGGGVAGVLEVMFDQQSDFVSGGFDAIQNITGINMEGVKEKVVTSIQNIRNTVVENLNNMKTAYEENGGGIKGVVAAGWEGIKGYYTAGFTFVDNLTGGKLTALKTKFSEKTSEIKEKVSEGWTNMKTSISTKMQQWNSDASAKLTALKTNFSSKVNEIKSNWSSGYENIKSTATSKMETAKSNVASKLNTIKSDFSSKLNDAFSTVSSVMENIRSKFSEKMEAAKNVVSGAIEKIKGFFNFEWSLPSIKLPHFKMEGKFSISPPSVPSFGVEWYRTGGIMTNPTVFGMNGSSLMVGGEAGAEAILPLSEFYTKLNNMLDRKINAINQQIKTHIEVHTYIDSDEVSNRTTEKVSENMAVERLKRR